MNQQQLNNISFLSYKFYLTSLSNISPGSLQSNRLTILENNNISNIFIANKNKIFSFHVINIFYY